MIRVTNHEQRTTESGFTLIELIITIIMFAILVGGTLYAFQVVLLSWSSQETRAGIDISLDRAIEEMVRDLREAKDVDDNFDGDGTANDEIRFTIEEDGSDTDYIYYLYNANDIYVPPPAFNQGSYELRKAALSGGINGTFTYGSGRLIIQDVLPPATSDLSFDGTMITIDLTVTRGDETIRSRTEVKPRDL